MQEEKEAVMILTRAESKLAIMQAICDSCGLQSEAQGIGIERLQHLQHCERYALLRDGKRATVQYYYDKNHRVSRSETVPNALADVGLADDALASLNALAGKQGNGNPEQFVQEFLDRLDAALGSTSVRRTGYKLMPYRLRVGFSNSFRKGDIDFTYDASSTWTAAQEVGTPGSSNGIYEEVHGLMAGNIGGQS